MSMAVTGDVTTLTYDVVVIGGGPGGSTVATLLAQQGRKVLVLERGRFPRFHIGESLMPESYWSFKRLGLLDEMKQSRFVKKYSVQFVTATGKDSQPFFFDEVNPHECSQTWQVVRSEFDQMMTANARKHGAEVWEDANVTEVLLEPTESDDLPRATGVMVRRGAHYQVAPVGQEVAGAAEQGTSDGQGHLVHSQGATAEGQLFRVNAKVVVDATGTNALLARKLGIKRTDPKLRKVSYFAHYKGARRDPGKNEGATLVLTTQQGDGWFWYIPLPDDVVSVGVVFDLGRMQSQYKSRGATPEEILEEEIKACRGLDDRMSTAERVSPVHVLSDFSYRATRCAGEGWVLVGDAFGFLDPMYSSGVFLALKSGEMAADAINKAFEAGDFSAQQLSSWGDGLAGGMQLIRKLVYAFYTKDFSFGKFMREYPHLQKNLVDLLIGNVFYEGVDEIFGPMAKSVELPEPMPLERPRAVAV
ncbi:MAG TPA: NAD(P)/FAD-dependent oxidoreductase [Tepidisphaeraceae bacterium]|nr:NAD(P)/FAD-dependent oxidoreductase [Tepidisphaeraceae bacterium]